jgi:hypothetical protein
MWIPEHRALSAPHIDPVAVWKHVALERARLNEQKRQGTGGPSLSVRTSFGFLLLMVLTQLLALRLGVDGARSTGLVLLSVILVQELPRALLGRALGRSSRILMSAAGGRTELDGAPLRGAAKLAFATVGSIANVLLAIAVTRLCKEVSGRALAPLQMLAGCQAAWGLGQACPLIPFRTGLAVARSLRPELRFVQASLSVVCVSALIALTGTSTWGNAFVPVLALVALASWRHLGDAHAESCDEQGGVAAIAQHAADLVLHDDPRRAIETAQQGLARARSSRHRSSLNKTAAWAAIALKDPIRAHLALERLPASDIDLHLVAAYLSCCNRLNDAVQLLEEARAHGHRAPETTRLLIDVFYRSGKSVAARALAETERQFLSTEDWEAIEAATAT